MVKKVKKRVVKKKVILPRKLSALVRIALRDIRKAEKAADKYIVDMGTYHEPTQIVCKREGTDTIISTQDVCVVCAAGSVMAFSLGAKIDQELEPGKFPDNMHQLEAINNLRLGDVGSAYSYVNDSVPEKVWGLQTIMPSYDLKNPEPFHKAMEKLQAKLIKNGL